nr:MAG TPA: hypothetical protein [Caudoviricetes sp.]
MGFPFACVSTQYNIVFCQCNFSGHRWPQIAMKP